MAEFKQAVSFEWDEGNLLKNLLKHGVTHLECEEVFGDPDKVVFGDLEHSKAEERFILLGKTAGGRILYVVFTVRNDRLRVISARDLNQKEVFLYEKRA
mgnify:CR=1 FL=1